MNVEVAFDSGIPESLVRWLFQRTINKRHALKKTDQSWLGIYKVNGQWYTVVIDFIANKAGVFDGNRTSDFVRPNEGWKTYDGRVADDGQHRVQMPRND